MPEPTYVLVVRVWREPDGRWAARLRGQAESGEEPSFDRAVPLDGIPAAVDAWLEVVTAR